MVPHWGEWAQIVAESLAIGFSLASFRYWNQRRSKREYQLRLWISRRSKRNIRQIRAGDLHPLIAQIFLAVISKRNREHILGDLEEEYCTSNKRFPRFWYWGQAIALVANYWWAALRRLAGLDAIRKLIRK